MQGTKLDSWKEIAAHLGRTVRTVQRWEQTEGLPVHRIAGDRIVKVYAWTGELDQWIRCQPVAMTGESPAEPGPVAPARSPWRPDPPAVAPVRLTVRRLLLPVAALLLLAAVPLSLWLRGPTPPDWADVHIEGHTLTALDNNGLPLWQKDLPFRVAAPAAYQRPFGPGRPYAAVDLDGDGRSEILVLSGSGPGDPEVPWTLHVLETDGHPRWSHQPSEAISVGDTHYHPLWVCHFTTRDLDGDGRREIVLISHHIIFYPAKVEVFDANGAQRGRFLHSGWIRDVAFLDWNGDGTEDLVCVGYNNWHDRGALFVLDGQRLDGVSPPATDRSGRAFPGDPATPLAYLLVPRDPLLAGLHEGPGRLDSVMIQGPVIDSRALYEYEHRRGQLHYCFDLSLRLTGVHPSSSYPLLYAHLHAQGLLGEPFHPHLLRHLDPPRYWTGQEWVTDPPPHSAAAASADPPPTIG